MRNALSFSVLVVGLALAACSPETREYPTGGTGGGGSGAGGPGGGGSGGNPNCEAGTDDCDGMPGCETPVTDDPKNCGGCGITCSLSCIAGVCNDPAHITAGYDHTCALTALGDLYCWGRNESGEVGIGSGIMAYTPAKVATSSKVIHVDAGGGRFNVGGTEQVLAHTCAVLDDTTVQCWGANGTGQLGIGQAGWRDTPTTVVSLVGAVSVSTGGRHTCALTNKNELFCWGANDRGQIGIGTMTPEEVTPVQVPLADVRQVSAGIEHTCAILMDNTLYCWGGDGLMGPLGLGGGADQPSPKVVSLTGVDQIASGSSHSCALKGGQQYCWGNGYQGQLGIQDEYTWRTTPTDPSALPSPIFVSAGPQHTASISSEGGGQVWVTGVNTPLGNGTTDTTYVPVAVNLFDAVEIAAGSRHTCVTTKKGQAFCWGGNGAGQVGSGAPSEDVLAPVPVVFLP